MGTGERRSIGERVARAVVVLASGVARVDQGVTRVARSVWCIALAVALLARLRRPLRGGGDPIVDEATVRQRVRALLDNGILPGIRASEILGKKRQVRQECTICGASIGVGDMAFEIPPPAGAMLAVHRRCFDLWMQEAADRIAET